MIRRKRGGRLDRSDGYEEDINPMEGTGNLADAMLVLALGMMIAVIMSWSVDFATPSSSMKELNNAKTMSEKEVQEVNSDDSLQEKGTVYQDPDTGKFYVRVDELVGFAAAWSAGSC